MSNPDITPERKALALAALALDLHVDCGGFEAHHTVNYRGKLVALADSALEALARAAEALGLEPDPAVQQQERTPAGMVPLAVAHNAIEKAVQSAIVAIIQKEPHTAMRAGNLINIDAEACGVGAEALANPPQDIAASDLPTPTDLHRTIGQARGLIQAAIGQTKDLDIPHASRYLWEASRELGQALTYIRFGLRATTPDPQEGGAEP